MQRHRTNAHKFTNPGLQNRRVQVRFLSHLPLLSGFVCEARAGFLSLPQYLPHYPRNTPPKSRSIASRAGLRISACT
jgi:hypothetical protein